MKERGRMMSGGNSALRSGFVAASSLHLVGPVLGVSALHLSTKPLLMPLLAAWFLSATPAGRRRTLVATGLGWSWLSDLGLMPGEEVRFLAGLGALLIAQLTSAAAFRPDRADRAASLLARPVLVLPELGALVALLAVLWAHLGTLRLPVTLYAAVIVAMAVLATGVNREVALGAALFVVSDALIALNSLAGLLRLPAHGFWVMATYLAAQGLIASGVGRRSRAGAVRPD